MITIMKNIDVEQEWHNFINNMESYASDPPEKWTTLTLLAYFLHKYKLINNIDFVFHFNKKGPTKTKEMKNASQIWSMFDKGRYKQLTTKEEKLDYKNQLVNILQQYINWAFDHKFYGRTTNITGLGLFTNANFINEFLQWRKKTAIILPKRKSMLPKELLEWITLNANEVYKKHQLTTLEHLNNLLDYIDAYKLDNTSIEYIIIKKARELGIMPQYGKIKLDKK